MPRPKKCAVCEAQFEVCRMGQKVCSVNCAIKHSKCEAKKRQRAKDRQTKDRLETVTEARNKAQKKFNEYIRVRDENRPCISCGSTTASMYHAGHFRSRKAAPQLAFNTFNCHRQCAECNTHLSANLVEYRIRLKQKIGEERVDRLECDQSFSSGDKEYYRRLAKVFAKRTRHLRRLRTAMT